VDVIYSSLGGGYGIVSRRGGLRALKPTHLANSHGLSFNDAGWMLKIPEFRSLGFFEKSRLRLSSRGRGASEEEIAALRIQRRERSRRSFFQAFVQAFCSKDSKSFN
jgi:hypothetical protein